MSGFAGANQRQLRAECPQHRQTGQQQVHAFLPGQPADHTEQRRRRHPDPARAVPAAPPCSPPALASVLRPEWRGEQARRWRDPRPRCIDAVQDARQHVGPCAQQTREPHAGFFGANFRRIGRRYRGDPVGELQSGLEQTDRAVKLHAIDGDRTAAASPDVPADRAAPCPERRGYAPSSPCPAAPRRDNADKPAPGPSASHARARYRGVALQRSAADIGGDSATKRRTGSRCRASPVPSGPRYGLTGRA